MADTVENIDRLDSDAHSIGDSESSAENMLCSEIMEFRRNSDSDMYFFFATPKGIRCVSLWSGEGSDYWEFHNRAKSVKHRAMCRIGGETAKMSFLTTPNPQYSTIQVLQEWFPLFLRGVPCQIVKIDQTPDGCRFHLEYCRLNERGAIIRSVVIEEFSLIPTLCKWQCNRDRSEIEINGSGYFDQPEFLRIPGPRAVRYIYEGRSLDGIIVAPTRIERRDRLEAVAVWTLTHPVSVPLKSISTPWFDISNKCLGLAKYIGDWRLGNSEKILNIPEEFAEYDVRIAVFWNHRHLVPYCEGVFPQRSVSMIWAPKLTTFPKDMYGYLWITYSPYHSGMPNYSRFNPTDEDWEEVSGVELCCSFDQALRI